MEQIDMRADVIADRGFGSAVGVAEQSSVGRQCAMSLGIPLSWGDTFVHSKFLIPDSLVIRGGEPSNDLWFVRTGILRLQRYGFDGRRQILSLFLPGEIVGFEGEFREGASVETVTQSGLCRIDRRKFDTMLNTCSGLRAEFFRQKQDQLDRLHWLTWSLGALGPEERLCAMLALATSFMPYRPLPDGTAVLSMLLPRKDIADLLSTTVETISRTIHKLSGGGFIEIRDSAQFRIMDLAELIALGQIESNFERLTRGITERSNRLNGLNVLSADCPVCYCGR